MYMDTETLVTAVYFIVGSRGLEDERRNHETSKEI